MNNLDTLRHNLILLQYEFDKAMLDGKCFEEVKKIFQELKKLKRDINLFRPGREDVH